jgi:hypothetical protein
MRVFQHLLLIFLALTFVPQAHARRRHKFKGVVVVNQILKLEGRILRNGEDAPEFSGVKQGDLLETQDKSSAVIRIPGLAIFRMSPNTAFRLTKFNDRNESRFEVTNGAVLALFRRPGEHEFVLNHSVIKLHGTTFYAVTSREGKVDQLCLCDGRVTVDAKENRKPSSAPAKSAVPSAAPTATATVAAQPTPTKSPLFGTSLTAEGSPKPTPVPPTPTPAPTPKLPLEVVLSSNNEHKQCEISADGIEMKSGNSLRDLHGDSEVKEL